MRVEQTVSEIQGDPVVPLRFEVQQKLGRCMMRLQQYELLVKRLVSSQVTMIPSTEPKGAQAKTTKDVSTKTLGHVVGELTGSILVVENSELNDQEADVPIDHSHIWIRNSFHLEFGANEHEQMKGELAELVDLRNDLVHHFIETYDVWSENGCHAADVYLQECYAKIDAQFLRLRGWANGIQDTMKAHASFMASPEFELLLNEMLPDGQGIDWPSTEIVRLLRGAELNYAKDGWTFLGDAIANIKTSHTNQTPKKYGCSSWRHVIHESKLFEIRKAPTAASGDVQVWYRSRG